MITTDFLIENIFWIYGIIFFIITEIIFIIVRVQDETEEHWIISKFFSITMTLLITGSGAIILFVISLMIPYYKYFLIALSAFAAFMIINKSVDIIVSKLKKKNKKKVKK